MYLRVFDFVACVEISGALQKSPSSGHLLQAGLQQPEDQIENSSSWKTYTDFAFMKNAAGAFIINTYIIFIFL
jgi:hypothetical protein